jgi:hypothetical protein
MSPELGVILLVTLLWGPTALWLVYRALRGSDGRLPESSIAVSEPMPSARLAADELEALVASDGFWVCDTCHSLNRREANRCYGCRTAKDSPGRQAPDELEVGPGVPVMLPVSRGFPVMAEDIARSARELPVRPGVPVMLPVSRGFPVMAEDIARSSGGAAPTTVALAAPRHAPPAPEIVAGAPEVATSAARPEAAAGARVCPFFGLKDDPSTRYDFPDPANRCHATSERGGTSVAPLRRFAIGTAGTTRSQPIGVIHQESLCLTAAHVQCAQYPAGDGVAANG